ncbi:MAG: hypothetical protein ACLSGI_12070 [Butyricicoccaceae bacterium]
MRTARDGRLGWQSEDLGLDKSIKTAFDGYTTLEESAKILAIVNEGEVSGAAAKGENPVVPTAPRSTQRWAARLATTALSPARTAL